MEELGLEWTQLPAQGVSHSILPVAPSPCLTEGLSWFSQRPEQEEGAKGREVLAQDSRRGFAASAAKMKTILSHQTVDIQKRWTSLLRHAFTVKGPRCTLRRGFNRYRTQFPWKAKEEAVG